MKFTKEYMNSIIEKYNLVAIYYSKFEIFIIKDQKELFKKEWFLVDAKQFLEKIYVTPYIKYIWINIDDICSDYKEAVDDTIEMINKRYISNFKEKENEDD